MKTHRDLEVWRLAIALAGRIYRFTDGLPQTERYGLAAQLRRATVSIAANVAEGAARRSSKEFRNHLYVSLGSASECDTLVEIAKETGLTNAASADELQADIATVARLLQGLLRSVDHRIASAGTASTRS